MAKTKRSHIKYMCKTDFDVELPLGSPTVEVYDSEEDLKHKRKCVATCGIVEVKITLNKIIKNGEKDYA